MPGPSERRVHDTLPPAGSPSTVDSTHAHRIAVIAAVARNGISAEFGALCSMSERSGVTNPIFPPWMNVFATAPSPEAQAEPVFVIGGEALYREAVPRADVLYLTELERDFAGDARFPGFDRSRWRESGREARTALDALGPLTYHFAVYERAER